MPVPSKKVAPASPGGGEEFPLEAGGAVLSILFDYQQICQIWFAIQFLLTER